MQQMSEGSRVKALKVKSQGFSYEFLTTQNLKFSGIPDLSGLAQRAKLELFMLRGKLFVGFYYRPPLVGTAARAGMMGKHSLSTLGAGCRVGCGNLLVGAPFIPF